MPIEIAIPCDVGEEFLGAAAVMAVLAYPEFDVASNRRKDQLIDVCKDYISQIHLEHAGRSRVTDGLREQHASRWVTRQRSTRNAEVDRAITRADAIIRKRRFSCVQIAMQVVSHQLLAAYAPSAKGAPGLSELRQSWTSKIGGADGDEDTMKRYWRQTRPILHLAYALYVHIVPTDSRNMVVTAITTREWLRRILLDAEDRVDDLVAADIGYDATQRIVLKPEK